jgi:hypothetical protein
MNLLIFNERRNRDKLQVENVAILTGGSVVGSLGGNNAG